MNTAHIREYDNALQTVEEHCINVAKYAAQSGRQVKMERLAALSGLLHDMGKMSDDFEKYIRGSKEFSRGSIDHCFAGAKYLLEAAGGDASLHKTACLLGRVILSHHGLHDWITEDCEDYYLYRTGKDDRYAQIAENFKGLSYSSEIRALLEAAEKEYAEIRASMKKLVTEMALPDSRSKNKALAFFYGMTERLLTSMLIDADRTDTAQFMSGTAEEKEVDTAVLWEEMNGKLQSKLSAFTDYGKIALQRKSISQRCYEFAKNEVGCCKLVVPTGGGKTLSSLRFAIEYCRRHGKKRIIYVAPFLSILEQNSDEIRCVAGDEAFLEHHSDAAFKMEQNGGEELQNYELHCERWNSPVIATTMVQFLNTLFSDKTSSVRRLHRLCDSVIIIDEIQSLPIKCVWLFDLAMNYLTRICGAAVVLCSATQPQFEKLKGYPLLIDANSMTGDITKDLEVFKRTEIINAVTKSGMTFEDAAQLCADKQKEYASLLAIVNTKAAAKALYQQIKSIADVETVHLSTNMCPQHRREAIKLLRQKLKNNKPVICVSTQLIEAGVDVSFGCVVRSLAGMDSAAQAAGRCNRHGEKGRICPVYLVNLSEEKLGSLGEIKSAQDVSRELLGGVTDDTDMLGVEFMAKYFDKFYGENKEKLGFPIKQPKTDLVELLSLNSDRSTVCGRRQPDMTSQAFKTAGQNFSVIDEFGSGVIAPYNDEAMQLIAQLNESHTPAQVNALMRKAQQYMVNVNDRKLNELASLGAVFALKSGVYALDERYYGSECGMTDEPTADGTIIL